MADFKLVIKCHWTKGKGIHIDNDSPSDEEQAENDDHQENVLVDEIMEET